MVDIVLVPGLWLTGDSWNPVARQLRDAGHRVQALTLPGLDGKPPGSVTLDQQIRSITDAIDGCPRSPYLVGHSAAAGLVYAALDRRVEDVAGWIGVSGFPAVDGAPLLGQGFAVPGGAILFPGWDGFDEADLVGMGSDARARFERWSRPGPGCWATEPVVLHHEARRAVPATLICTEFTQADLRSWMADGAAPVAEIAHLADLATVDLRTGHWPQLTKPVELANRILDAVWQ